MNTTKEKFEKKALNYLAKKSCFRVSAIILFIFFFFIAMSHSFRENSENIMMFSFILLISNGFVIFTHAYPMSRKFIENDLLEDTAEYLKKREIRNQEEYQKKVNTKLEELKNA